MQNFFSSLFLLFNIPGIGVTSVSRQKVGARPFRLFCALSPFLDYFHSCLRRARTTSFIQRQKKNVDLIDRNGGKCLPWASRVGNGWVWSIWHGGGGCGRMVGIRMSCCINVIDWWNFFFVVPPSFLSHCQD